MHLFVSYFLVILSSFNLQNAVASLLEPVVENVVHLQTALPPPDVPGIWKKKMIWKARWVQEWKSSKTYRPVWRKVWSPVEIREWVPVPRPPPPPPQHELPAPDVAYLPDSPDGPPGPTVGPSGPPSDLPGSQAPPPFRPVPPSNNYGPPSGSPSGQGSQRPPQRPQQRPPQGPPPVRPSPPSNKYGPPPAGSTPLQPVNNPPSWGAPDMQALLSSYHTIRDPDVDAYNEEQNRLERGPVNYHANPDSGSQTISEFFEPPKQPQRDQQYRQPDNKLSAQQDKTNSVSPYAAKLADAVIRERLNKGISDRPSGLTDIIYRADSSTTAPNSVSESPSNVYVVTPVSFGYHS